MRQFVELFFSKIAINAMTLMAALPIFYGGVWALREFQAAYIPVIVDFEVTRFEKLAPDKAEFWGNMTKRFEYADGLPMCRFSNMAWWARLPDGSVTEAKWWTLERPLGQVVNRLPGRQNFGPWMVDYRGHPEAVELFGVASHWCIGFWPSETRLGPLKLRSPT